MAQVMLLSAGFLVLVAISAASVLFVNKARDDSGWVIHTVEVENQTNTVLLEIRRAESRQARSSAQTRCSTRIDCRPTHDRAARRSAEETHRSRPRCICRAV